MAVSGYGTFGQYNNYGIVTPDNMQQRTISYQNIPAQNTNTFSCPMIAGRMVDQESEIAPGEVPMDGKSVAVFVQNNLEHVYVKKWGGDGRIYTNTYVLDRPQQPVVQGPSNDILEQILGRLDGIEKQLMKQKKSSNPNYRKNNYKPQTPKQEVESHE